MRDLGNAIFIQRAIKHRTSSLMHNRSQRSNMIRERIFLKMPVVACHERPVLPGV